MMFTMKLFSLGVIVANVVAMSMVQLLVASNSSVDAFSGVMKNQQTRTQTRSRQPSQQPSSSPLLPPLAYLMREGDNEFDDNGNSNSNSNNESTTKKKRRMTLSITSIIPTSTGGIKATGTIVNLKVNNYVEEKAMIDDLQNQHLQMMQMQQQHKHKQQSSLSLLYSATTPPTISYVYAPSSGAPALTTGTAIIPPSSMTMSMRSTITAAATTNNNNLGSGIYDKLHDDLNQLNIQLLRSKVSFIRRLLPKNKKQYIERFVDFMIQFIL